jgi:hypothetical protein
MIITGTWTMPNSSMRPIEATNPLSCRAIA